MKKYRVDHTSTALHPGAENRKVTCADGQEEVLLRQGWHEQSKEGLRDNEDASSSETGGPLATTYTCNRPVT